MTRKFNCIFPRDPARRATEILKPNQQSHPYNSLQNERIQNKREEKSLITPAISSINRSSNVFFCRFKTYAMRGGKCDYAASAVCAVKLFITTLQKMNANKQEFIE